MVKSSLFLLKDRKWKLAHVSGKMNASKLDDFEYEDWVSSHIDLLLAF